MPDSTSDPHKAQIAERLRRQQRVARRTALIVAALIIAALLGPFLAHYIAA